MFKTIDLFAGCGGLTEGFKRSKIFEIVAGVEWDKDALFTLRNRLSKKWFYKDAEKRILHFDIQRTNDLVSGYDDELYGSSEGFDKLVKDESVDVVIGGPPCQSYSIAGRIRDEKGMHDDYRNFLFESYIKIVDRYRPRACIFENVLGMLSAKPGGISITDRVRKSFFDIGYYITDDLKAEAVFDTSEFLVPQKRVRVIIVAIDMKRYADFKERVNLFYSNLNRYKSEKVVTVSEALGGLPAIFPLESPMPRSSHFIDKAGEFEITAHEPRYHNERDISIFKLLAEDIQSGGFQYASSDALKELYTKKTGRKSSVHKYHVLRSDKPSNTIPAHLYKDGLRHIHPDPSQARSITVREAARLQTFDDDFEFLGSRGSQYKMIGNAVPPVFAEKIALSLGGIL
ncbi:DNA cytosine methyltransferase [Paenalcaligenes hominis]|uniref:DNA cytosine methyltransferase n=1 Tax=Paenalcaligenes hominis TaxID=643674 RepID=UPI0035236248